MGFIESIGLLFLFLFSAALSILKLILFPEGGWVREYMEGMVMKLF